MGTPRKDVIGGWPGGNPKLDSWVCNWADRIGRGSEMSRPNTPLPVGLVPILVSSSVSIPAVTNSESAVPSSLRTPSAP